MSKMDEKQVKIELFALLINILRNRGRLYKIILLCAPFIQDFRFCVSL